MRETSGVACELSLINLFAGQIAANEALKKDLEEVILGLQEYLRDVKTQTKQATDECKELRKEKESLLKKLGEVEEERNQLEIVAIDAENLRKVSFRRHLSSSNTGVGFFFLAPLFL